MIWLMVDVYTHTHARTHTHTHTWHMKVSDETTTDMPKITHANEETGMHEITRKAHH